MEKVKVLFVCLGNICRSPMAEGIFEHLVEAEGLMDKFEIDSAGTSGYHVGERPDRRGAEVCLENGISLTSHSRQLKRQDLSTYDYILAMDRSNFGNIKKLQNPGANYRAKILQMLEFDPENGPLDVPDPYYGGNSGFKNVFDLLERSNKVFLSHVREERGF